MMDEEEQREEEEERKEMEEVGENKDDYGNKLSLNLKFIHCANLK